MEFAKTPLKLHADIIDALQLYLSLCTENCLREDRLSISTVCECVLKVKHLALRVNRVNPILGTFYQELIRLKKPLRSEYQRLVDSIIGVLKNHRDTAKTYFNELDKRCSEQCKSYWRTWADSESGVGTEDQASTTRDAEFASSVRSLERKHTTGHSTNEAERDARERMTQGNLAVNKAAEDELREVEKSRICSPGRKRVRPCIAFKSKIEDGCNKNYKTSKSHSPGLLTVQCACDTPKLLEFVVMLQAESVSMALSAVLSHF